VVLNIILHIAARRTADSTSREGMKSPRSPELFPDWVSPLENTWKIKLSGDSEESNFVIHSSPFLGKDIKLVQKSRR